MHPDGEALQRLLHGEVDACAAADFRRHLSDCQACRARLAEEEARDQVIEEALSALDHPMEPVVLSDILVLSDIVARAAPPAHRVLVRAAAAVVVGLALAGAAYAAPGSPLPALLRDMAAPLRARTSAPADEEAGAPSSNGIAVRTSPDFTIQIEGTFAGGELSVRVASVDELSVTSTGGRTSYGSDPTRLSITAQEPGTNIEIIVPAGPDRVRVLIGERIVWRKDGADIGSVVRPDASGTYHLP
jgi:hypothetical protein